MSLDDVAWTLRINVANPDLFGLEAQLLLYANDNRRENLRLRSVEENKTIEWRHCHGCKHRLHDTKNHLPLGLPSKIYAHCFLYWFICSEKEVTAVAAIPVTSRLPGQDTVSLDPKPDLRYFSSEPLCWQVVMELASTKQQKMATMIYSPIWSPFYILPLRGPANFSSIPFSVFRA